MEVRLLGPVGIWRDDRQATLARSHRRCVLASLAMAPGQPVALESLVDRVWGDQPPREAIHSLYTHVSAVRRALQGVDDSGTGAMLRRVQGAYVLDIDPNRVDLYRARRYLAEARAVINSCDGRDVQAAGLLRQASRLWRGVPLTGLSGDWARRVRQGLDQERLALLVERYRIELRLGEHATAVGPLAALLADHPLTEPLACLRILALYRCGRQADALELYAGTRRRLIDELGDEPGVELRQLHEQVLRRDPALDLVADGAPGGGGGWAEAAATVAAVTAATHPPAQLPPDAAAFTGRTAALAELDSVLADREGTRPNSVVVVAIEGTAGVGKTALAVHWAHRVRSRFPDGQLHVDLRGHTTGRPLPPIEALARFLHALGLAAEQVPADVDEAATRYRSLVADKQLLVVLDDAAGPDQVRPMLPGGASSVVLVTSRNQLGGLVARDGAHQLTLPVLDTVEARELLTRTVGSQRARAEPSAIAELAQVCAHLPLALRVAAANLAARRRHRIADYVMHLRDVDRVTALRITGDPRTAVAAAFDQSYLRLPHQAKQMLRRLGLAPGPDVTVAAAAALAGTSPDEAAQLLEVLASGHLVEEHVPGRYRLHGLLRRYAAGRAQREDDLPARDAALARLRDHLRMTYATPRPPHATRSWCDASSR